MKNLKIRMKILLSFGIVLAMILAAFTYVIIRNVTIGNAARDMQAEFQLAEIATELSEHSGLINTGLRVISISFDNEQYSEISANIEESRDKLNEAKAFIGNHPHLSVFGGQIDDLGPIIDRWSYDIGEINTINQEIEQIIARAHESQVALTSMSTAIFDYQMELATDEASQTDIEADARVRRVSRIEQGMDIASRLTAIGSSFELMFQTLDTSNMETDMALFNETVDVLTEFLEGSALQFNIDTATAMLEALEVYRVDIEEFETALAARAGLIESGSADAEIVTGMVATLVKDIETLTLMSGDETIASTNIMLIIVIAAAAVVLVISIILALYLSSIISVPIITVSTFMQKAGTSGDITLRQSDVEIIEKLSRQKDEIGQLIGSTSAFVKHITNMSAQLEQLAGGDLTSDLHVLSDKDVIGISVKNLTDSLNGVFAEINKATLLVANGSKQIAEGAQTLAEGSTQQAATIEELSSSVTDIASKTGVNADMANKAASLAGTIMNNAEKGSRQMDDMMAAVKEINDASQNIVNVIKVIEDISFQTNILALNAAVEAARAGQHGKGFAVVAEEVRNLATKSSEAAKETGNLIANSSEKAELGSRIANDTSASLAEIVDGIRESSRLVNEIAQSSSEQSADISQINTGIDQVAHVVQQNSATAQQSAASSEEMSSQSIMLEKLVEQFKLKSEAPRRLGSGDEGKY